MVKRINHEIWDAGSNKSGLRPPNQNGPWAVGSPCFAPTLNFAQALLGGKLSSQYSRHRAGEFSLDYGTPMVLSQNELPQSNHYTPSSFSHHIFVAILGGT